jgi:predicted nucleotidyltransferase
MVSAVKEKIPALLALCSRRGVRRLSVFGSAARGDFDPRSSDIDVLVEFEPMTPAQHAEAYFGRLEEAEALFGRRVDLVEPQSLRNPYIRERVEATREVVYGA